MIYIMYKYAFSITNVCYIYTFFKIKFVVHLCEKNKNPKSNKKIALMKAFLQTALKKNGLIRIHS